MYFSNNSYTYLIAPITTSKSVPHVAAAATARGQPKSCHDLVVGALQVLAIKELQLLTIKGSAACVVGGDSSHRCSFTSKVVSHVVVGPSAPTTSNESEV